MCWIFSSSWARKPRSARDRSIRRSLQRRASELPSGFYVPALSTGDEVRSLNTVTWLATKHHDDQGYICAKIWSRTGDLKFRGVLICSPPPPPAKRIGKTQTRTNKDLSGQSYLRGLNALANRRYLFPLADPRHIPTLTDLRHLSALAYLRRVPTI